MRVGEERCIGQSFLRCVEGGKGRVCPSEGLGLGFVSGE